MRWLLFPFTLSFNLTVGYIWVLLMLLIGAARAPRFEYYAILVAEWREWATKIWKYSTTIGYGIILQPDIRDEINGPSNRVERHEDIHTIQFEDALIISFCVALPVYLVTNDWLLALIIQWSGGLWQLIGYLAAAIRYGLKNAYRDSEYERSAYAQTDLIRDAGMSWLELRAKERDEKKTAIG